MISAFGAVLIYVGTRYEFESVTLIGAVLIGVGLVENVVLRQS